MPKGEGFLCRVSDLGAACAFQKETNRKSCAVVVGHSYGSLRVLYSCGNYENCLLYRRNSITRSSGHISTH